MEHESLSENEIARLNSCSFSTAKNDVAEILKEYRHIFGMQVEHGGVRFTNKNLAETNKVIYALFSESLNIQLILEIFDHPFQTRQAYCHANRISEASFYRAIKSINKVFKSYGFLIQFNQGGYYLKAKSEEELRSFIVSLYLETKTIQECFIRIPFKVLKKIVAQNILSILPLDFDLYYTYYSYYTYVSLIRESQGFVQYKSKMKHTFDEYDLLLPYFPKLRQEHLFSLRQSFLNQMDPWESVDEKNSTLQIFENFLREFSKLNSKIINENLVEKLLLVCILTYSGFEFFPAKYKILFNRIDVFIDHFKKDKLKDYDNFQMLFQKVNSQLKHPFDDQANQLLFWIEILLPEFYIKSGETKVKIYSDLGLEHKNYYKSVFSDLFTDIRVLGANNKEKADFIITNHFIEEREIPVIFIGDYPSLDDIAKIHESMMDFLVKKHAQTI